MTKAPTLPTITGSYASSTQLNAAFRAIEDSFENTLSLDGSTPNSMNADLDMNSNDILNAGLIEAQNIVVGGVDLQDDLDLGYFRSRADALVSEVPAGIHTVRVVNNNTEFTYYRITTNTAYAALTTNAGTVFWAPLAEGGAYDPAAWGDGWSALWNCAQWQIAALGSVTIKAMGQTFEKPSSGSASTRRISASGIPVNIDMGDCRLNRAETDLEPFFAFSGGYSANTVLTGVAYSDVTYIDDDEEAGEGSEGGSTSTKRTVLTLTSAAGFENSTGQVAFISSTDPNPHHSPRLMGEHVVIDRISGATANVQGRLYGNYTTAGGNVRLWLMNNVKISVRGGVWEDLGNRDVANRDTLPMVHIEAAKGPEVFGLTVRFAESHVVQFVNCYDYIADGFTIDYMANKTNPWHDDNNPVGENPVAYGVRVANSQGGVARNMRGRHLRHIVDHLCLPASSFSAFSYLRSGSTPVGVGATIACRAEASFSQGASSAPFGTHDGTIGCIFTGNTVVQPRTTAWAFRGVNHVMSGNRDEGAVTVFRGFIGSNWIGPPAEAATRGIAVRDHTSVNPRGSLLTLNDGAESFRVDGWTLMFTTDADPEVSPQRIVWLKNGGAVSISNLTIEARRSITIGELCLIEGTNDATVRLESGSMLDYSGSGEITTLFKNLGTGECTHMVRNMSAHRVPDQSQFVMSLFSGAAPAVGSHVRASRIVGLWSQDQVAPNRATVAAAYVSPDCNAISYRDGNALITLLRDATGTALSMADGSDWAPPHGTLNPRQFGTLGSGDDTAVVSACHGWANSKKLPVAYTGIEQVQIQSDALIPMQTSTDFAGCVLKAVGGIRPAPNTWSMSTARQMFIVTDPGTPLNTSTITPTVANMAEGSRVPCADFFTLPGYAAIEVASGQPDTITDRQHIGVTGYLQPFRISAEGQSVNPLARNLAASTSINVKWRAMPVSGHLTIRGAVIDLSTMNNQKVFVVQRNDTSVESISFTGWNAMPSYHAHALLRFEDCCDITIRDVTGSALDNDPDSSSYVVSAASVVEVDLENSHFVDGWGAIGTNQIDGWRVHNCTLNRLDAHNGGGNIIVSDCTFKDIGVVIGWGWGSLQISNCRLVNCPALSSRADYDGAWFMGSITIDGMSVQSVNFTQTILDWSTLPIGSKAGLSINLPGAIVVQNITGQRRPGAGTETRNIVPLSVTIEPTAAAVVSAQSVVIRNITNPNAVEVNNRWPALDLNSAGGVATEFRLENIAARAKTSNVARATFLVPAVTGGRSPTGAPVNLKAVGCDKLSISAPDAGSSSFEINACEVGRVQTGNRFVSLSGCTLTDPAFFSPETEAPIGGTMAGTALYTSVMSSNVLAAGFNFSNVAALSGVAIRAATSPTLPAGATKATALTGWLAAGF